MSKENQRGKQAPEKIKALVLKKNTIQVVDQGKEVAGFITQAIKQGLPVETMEKLFALKERYDANVAREAFVVAMAKFQAECPIIKKTAKVMEKDKVTVRYKYAPLDVIVKQVKDVLANNNFSYTIKTINEKGTLTSVCKITHSLGHSEESAFAVPIDRDAYMSEPQKYASASTFSKRYAFCNALGILTGDEDDDNTIQVGSKPKFAPHKQIDTSKPLTPDKISSQEELTGIVLSTISKLNDPEKVEKIGKKVKASKLYSEETKKTLLPKITARVNAIVREDEKRGGLGK